MIHEMTPREAVRNKISQGKKKKKRETNIERERDQSDSSDLFAVDHSFGAISRQYIV